jgi:lysophospholipase L1-like esterase
VTDAERPLIFIYFAAAMKNHLHYSFLLCLLVIGGLILLHHAPEQKLGSLTLKTVDILADVRSDDMVVDSLPLDEPTAIEPSIVAKQDSVVEVMQESCPKGLICVEDYSSDSTALRDFLEALAETQTTKKNLRVAFYGDSFIEGDVFCGSFRDTLQSVFGGSGVGFVPITSEVTGFRNTIKHRFDNWKTASLIKRKDSVGDIGPAGFCFAPEPDNWVEYKPSKQRNLRAFNTIKLYYKNREGAILHATIDTLEVTEPLEPSGRLEEWKHRGNNIKYVKMEFEPYQGLEVYGASFEGEGGVYVDNFSLRGNSGLNLNGVSSQMYRDFNRYRNYKLMILQFGLNLVVEEKLNYKAYTERMVKVINNLKRNFPNTSFLLLSVSDRSTNLNGKFQTMNAIPVMRNAQRLIAKETGIAFWDMYEAMGGHNSMIQYVKAKPALASKDYTHLTFKGGKKLAGSLVKSLLFEHEKHSKSTAISKR